MNKKQKVILLGDSITQGLGSKKINFTQALQDRLGASFIVENLALTGTTILYAKQILDDIISREPDYVVIVYGNVDAQIRPNRQGHILRKWGQKIDNWLRYFFSVVIYKVDGSEQWVNIEQFHDTYIAVLKKLLANDCHVLTCSTVYIDDRLFPGSLNQYKIFNQEITRMAKTYQCNFVDLFNPLQKKVQEYGWEAYYNYDHFHPNRGGYELISDILSRQILQGQTYRR
jgi:lysophospholipase L1-like esterase